MSAGTLPRLLIAGPMSGSGKTTLTAGLIAALTARGLHVAPFKCGPDYIDPSYHALAAGRPCANLDAWMIPPAHLPAVMARRAADADLALVEGVMGLFDGHGGGDEGSSAHIAHLTATPVVIVLGVRSMARTAAALVAGLRDFDPRLRVAGVILNHVGSASHARMVTRAIEDDTGLPVLGALARDEALAIPERHLGLIPTAEPGRWRAWLDEVRLRVEAGVALDRLMQVARSAPALPQAAPWPPRSAPPAYGDDGPVIAVARDEAFSFLYEENLEQLREAGARLAFFSPLRDRELPAGSGGVYLCGGFPELYADALAANEPLLAALRGAARAGLPIYAECGGLMYLTEAVVDAAGVAHPMVGLLPGRSAMTGRVTLGYRTVRAREDSWLWRAGETVRGHEFHYSLWEERPPALPWLYERLPDARRPDVSPEGARIGSVLASYVHLHFLAAPQLAERFVAAARRRQPEVV